MTLKWLPVLGIFGELGGELHAFNLEVHRVPTVTSCDFFIAGYGYGVQGIKKERKPCGHQHAHACTRARAQMPKQKYKEDGSPVFLRAPPCSFISVQSKPFSLLQNWRKNLDRVGRAFVTWNYVLCLFWSQVDSEGKIQNQVTLKCQLETQAVEDQDRVWLLKVSPSSCREVRSKLMNK